MTPLTTAAVLAGLVALATALGFVWRAQDGRLKRVSGDHVIIAADLPGAGQLGSGATLVQFSSEVCAPCRATYTVLDALASENSAIAHVDVDVTTSPELVSRFNILQTPTTLIVDSRGVVRARIGGAAQRETVRAELGRILVAA